MTDNNDTSKHGSAPDNNKQSTENSSLPQQIDSARLNRVFDISSEKNRNFLFSFLAAQLYVLIAVGSTTDLNLLLSTSLFSLPVINVKIPVVGFYLFAPLLLLVFHVNLLINLSEHVALLKKWQNAGGNSQIRFPYLINVITYYMIKGEKSFQFYIVKSITVFAIILLPLFIFVFIQIRFSDYHNMLISSFHAAIFFADFYILYKYISTLSIPIIQNSKNKFPLKLPILMSFFSVVNIVIVGIIVMLNPSYMDPKNWISTESLKLDSQNMQSEDEMKRILRDKKFQKLAETTNMLKEYLIPHLHLHEYKISKIGEELKEDLEGRHLELANLNGAILYNVNLRNASLENTTLRSTIFEGANLFSTQLENTDLNSANLKGADLRFARLKGASLKDAQLEKADLRYARLKGANLKGANLSAANLTGAIIRQDQLDKACGSKDTILPKGLSVVPCSQDQ